MRKLIVSMNITLDGYMSGLHCDLDWHFKYWSEEMGEVLCTALSKADTILLGRNTYQAMARYWPSKVADTTCRGEDFAFAEMMNRYTKIVFSSTISQPGWQPTKFISGDVKHTVRCLKHRPGKDIIVYGSGKLVQALISSGCVDEFQLWLHPVLLGEGKRLFSNDQPAKAMHFSQSKVFKSGVVLLTYQIGTGHVIS